MKRALAIAVAVCTLGFAGFSQIAIKGSWTASACLLPSVSATSTLSLTYSVAGFDVTGALRFGAGGIDRASFTGRGAFGPFSVVGRMWFNPAIPEYMGSDLVTSFDFGGVGIGMTVRHWDTDYNDLFVGAAWPFGPWYPDPTPCQTTDGPFGMQYIFTTTVAPLTLKAVFADCCTGIEFYQALITLKGVDLCCGIKYNAELSFLKEKGFDYITFSGINVPLCCGISFDVEITYTVNSKTVDLKPKFAGLGEACFTVWGNPVYNNYVFSGIEIYGFRIRCTLADCNFIEFVNAFNVTEVNKLIPAADAFATACGEYEMVKIGFCGAACCGGRWDATLRVYFGTGNTRLFGITRLTYTVNIPIMTGFTLNLTGRAGVGGCATQSFCIGWTMTF